jgi:hypothetical protein
MRCYDKAKKAGILGQTGQSYNSQQDRQGLPSTTIFIILDQKLTQLDGFRSKKYETQTLDWSKKLTQVK